MAGTTRTAPPPHDSMQSTAVQFKPVQTKPRPSKRTTAACTGAVNYNAFYRHLIKGNWELSVVKFPKLSRRSVTALLTFRAPMFLLTNLALSGTNCQKLPATLLIGLIAEEFCQTLSMAYLGIVIFVGCTPLVYHC